MNAPIFGKPIALDVNSLPLLGADEVPSVYCNNVNAALAPWDIRLLFSELVMTGKEGEASHFLRANVVMNPAHAKALSAVLGQVIEAYEKQYGTIQAPKVPTQPPPAERLS